MNFLLFILIIVILFFPFFYLPWGNRYIDKSKDLAKSRFLSFEEDLIHSIEEYKVYSNVQPSIWNEVEYKSKKTDILDSFRWLPGLGYPTGNKFDLKVCEDKKNIYIGLGSNDFKWHLMQHAPKSENG